MMAKSMKAKMEIISAIDINYISMFKQLTEYMDINYSVMDTQGNVVLKNSAFEKRFPHLNELSNLEVWNHCRNVMESGKRATLEEEYEGKFYFSIKQPIINKNKCEGIMVLSFDITAQKQAEIAKINLLENMTHDFNTPFNGIIGLTQILSISEKNPDRKRRLDMIIESGERIHSLMRKILDVVKIDDPDELQKIIFNVKEATKDVILMDKTAAELKNIDIKVNCDDKIIKAPKLCFEKILLNIVSNSIKFTEKGIINVDIQVKKEKLKISVSDTGIGIAKKDQKIIFDKFYRVKDSCKENKYRGSGLGLHIVKSLVEKMKGEIYLKSALGKGSTFKITLPIQKGE